MNKKLNDGVGKKIVEALKKQSKGELPEQEETTNAVDGLIPNIEEAVTSDFEQEEKEDPIDYSDIKGFDSDIFNEVEEKVSEEDSSKMFSEIDLDNFAEEIKEPKFSPEVTEFEIPPNILILKRLISQLPSGVTRHTGAQIIKQTMEALGISMKNVLKEAQEVQDGLKESAKECQATIQEYKKQIASLEKQSQNYQKQYGALNDLISLFIQTTK